MKAIIIDDEQIALDDLESELREFPEITEIIPFISPDKALKWLHNNTIDIAFLDISMGHIGGLSLAEKLREYHPYCAVIFVTGYSEYALQAFRIHASGYLMKPVCKDDLRNEIDYIISHPQLYKPVSKRIRAQCFGNFEVFADNVPMKFQYSKTKELFAYLIDRRGASCSINALCAILWENKCDSAGLKSRLRHLISDLNAALKKFNSEDLLVKRRGMVAVLPDKIECDYYSWLSGDPAAASTYGGEYMYQYSWAEMTAGSLSN